MFSWILKCQFLGPYITTTTSWTNIWQESVIDGWFDDVSSGAKNGITQPWYTNHYLVIPTSLYKLHMRKNPVLWLGPIVPCKSTMMTFHLSEDRKWILIHPSILRWQVSLPKSQISWFLEKKGCGVSVFAQWWQLLKPKFETKIHYISSILRDPNRKQHCLLWILKILKGLFRSPKDSLASSARWSLPFWWYQKIRLLACGGWRVSTNTRQPVASCSSLKGLI